MHQKIRIENIALRFWGDIKNIVIATDAGAVSTLQTLLNDAKRIADNQEYAGIGIELVQEAYEKYAELYTIDESGNHIVDSNSTIAQLSPAISELYRVVNEALIKMDTLSKQQ